MSLYSDIEELPNDPGVYLIKDKEEKVIYVGKAKNLKKRVNQHFHSSLDSKEEKLQELAHRIDWILTRNESEAIMLEKKLIKQLSPKFNSMLKDDKSHLMIRITTEEQYPQLLIVRETDSRNPKSTYFGPFTNDTMLRQTVKMVLKLFPICNCGRNVEKIRKKGTSIRCMRERLGRCLAPHKTNISPEEYKKTVKNVISFLNGNIANLIDDIENEMWLASKESNFEKAANLRDLIRAVRTILNISEDLRSSQKNIDALAFVEEENTFAFCKIEIRDYKITTIKNFIYPNIKEKPLTTVESVLNFIYGGAKLKYRLMVKKEFLQRFGNDTSGKIRQYKSATSTEILVVAEKNAKTELRKYLKEKQFAVYTQSVLDDLQNILKLPEPPFIIHGFDISTLKGKQSVGSCVVFVDGKPQKDLYRKFRIRKKYEETNDYAMMKEVISRKYISKSLKNDPLPNLIIIDGGKGQLTVGREVLASLALSFPIISIAKKKEEIFVPWSDESILLDRDSQALKLVQFVRDEAHRFAISYHKKLRLQTVKKSIFEEVKGIGKVKTQILFEEYKNISNIAKTPIEDIMKKLAVNEKIASMIINMAKNILKSSKYNNS
ncbi:MAG: excinuclease ABC subunit UvrC [Candidatus Heimdallarchaeaceae archaeon]